MYDDLFAEIEAIQDGYFDYTFWMAVDFIAAYREEFSPRVVEQLAHFLQGAARATKIIVTPGEQTC